MAAEPGCPNTQYMITHTRDRTTVAELSRTSAPLRRRTSSLSSGAAPISASRPTSRRNGARGVSGAMPVPEAPPPIRLSMSTRIVRRGRVDCRAFAHPRYGVRTLFLQAGNYRHSGLVYPGKTAEFIRAAHARGMKVVAWYLPLFKSVDTDFTRVERSLQFRTSDGQAFDSFALDIEADTVPIKTRIQHLLELSARIRVAVGPSYPLGAIIPSPRGLIRVPTYWPGFPYRQLPAYYDVIAPMSYYTF